MEIISVSDIIHVHVSTCGNDVVFEISHAGIRKFAEGNEYTGDMNCRMWMKRVTGLYPVKRVLVSRMHTCVSIAHEAGI